jgi:hypothetical protein
MTKLVDDRQIERIRKMAFSSVYPMYVQKAEKKGKSKKQVDEILRWLTGYSDEELLDILENKTSIEELFLNADRFNEKALKITGTICGYRIEEIGDEIVRKVRCLDKLIDDVAKGKTLEQMIDKLDKKAQVPADASAQKAKK